MYDATANENNTARIWDTNTGSEIATLNHDFFVNDVSFSPDGQFIATASRDNTAQIRHVFTADIIQLACQRLTRNLSVREWQRYIGNKEYQKTFENLPYPDDYASVSQD